MLTPFWQVPFHAFSELAGSGFLDLQCDDAGEPDQAGAQSARTGSEVFATTPAARGDSVAAA
jgi:hypothetical protein